MTINDRLTIKYACYAIAFMGLLVTLVIARPAHVRAQIAACIPPPPPAPPPPCLVDSLLAAPLVPASHGVNNPILMLAIRESFRSLLPTSLLPSSIPPPDLKNWMIQIFFKSNLRPVIQDMTQKFSAASMHRAFTIGTFFDAKEQLEAQRDHQYLQAMAHKDYQPSKAFCAIGTSARSLAASEAKKPLNQRAMARRAMVRSLGSEAFGARDPADSDARARWVKFTKTYCNADDNKWADGTDFSEVCVGVTPSARTNRDLDYTRFIDEPRTIDGVDFTDGATSAAEEDIFALANNLYDHNLSFIDVRNNEENYFKLRTSQARRAIATDSFQNIVALKASGTPHKDGDVKTRPYLGALVSALGVPEKEVFGLIGENPSYFAQLELLSKKIAQNPTFFANLYDKPANVERISVALRAIELMIDREIYESRLRQEMQASALLASRLPQPSGGAR